MTNRQIYGIKVSGVTYELNLGNIVSHMTSPSGKDYILKIDDDGNLYAETTETSTTHSASEAQLAALDRGILFVNEFYCGGKDANEHTLNYCSHNFVELANISANDINLSGASLQYAISENDWSVLPLSGVIKAGSTFVIRGAQCSKLTSPTTRIIVDKFDMEWRTNDGQLITFDSEKSCKFYLTYNLTKYAGASPYDYQNSKIATDAIGYIDLVGVQGTQNPGGHEGKVYSNGGGLSNKKLFKRYYILDPVSQATKATNKRSNATDWNYVDLTKDDNEVIPCVEVYRPGESREGKNIFFNKTGLDKNKPSMITCSFGIQATDNGAGATRCFNWLTGNLADKYIWIRDKGSSDWGKAHHAFMEGDGRSEYTVGYTYVDDSGKTVNICDSIFKEYSNNTVIIAYKFIMSGISNGTYEYVAGKINEDGTPNLEGCTDIREFVVKRNQDVSSGFKFVQTSDQQGFNWDEYRLWQYAGQIIDKEYGGQFDFMVNTGDMTQNGNRLGEWLDYFQAKSEGLKNTVEMATIGNNDLSLRDLSKMGDGGDGTKLWLENITFYYTFEPDPDNLPVFEVSGISYYMPSLYSFNYGFAHFLCVNSEIKSTAESGANAYNFKENGVGVYGKFYPQIKVWCENDMQKYSSSVNLAYCHEMPFTILTNDVALKDPASPDWATAQRIAKNGGGCSACFNTPSSLKYWLSEFFQTHNISLVFGGHKHTEATSWPLLENVKYAGSDRTVDSMHPIIVVNSTTLADFDNATKLVSYNGYNYPNSWFIDSAATTPTQFNNAYACRAHLVSFAMESDLSTIKSNNYGGNANSLNPVVYAMSQATAYKHTSNKELPSPNIPWLRYYFPCGAKSGDVTSAKTSDELAVNTSQLFPFFTIWEIKPSEIVGNVRKLYGGFNNNGKFDINVDGQWTRQGKCATTGGIGGHESDLFSINGITSMTNEQAQTDTRTIKITL